MASFVSTASALGVVFGNKQVKSNGAASLAQYSGLRPAENFQFASAGITTTIKQSGLICSSGITYISFLVISVIGWKYLLLRPNEE